MFDSLPKKVKIVEVGPRDGLQNEKEFVDILDKEKFIRMLSECGFDEIEVGSFVSPRAIPQMKGSDEIYKSISDIKDVKLSVLIPNQKGLDIAHQVGLKKGAFFTATSNLFTQKNINCTVEESLIRLDEIIEMNKTVCEWRGYISTAFGCPYEGNQSLDKLLGLIKELKDRGVTDVSIGDTIGVANPKQVFTYLSAVKDQFGTDGFALHFHDTRGMAIANITVALELGFSTFDASAAGLGGCPYAMGASGNVATEDVIYLLDSMGIEHGIDIKKLIPASKFILSKLNKTTSSKNLQVLLKE